ncbi:MAG: DsbA family protein [Patescibacteria group bacterium]|jgi:protein-disulfide isomerase|nr:DsbA family protein [Patescibacteria group bacterium]
MSGNKDFFDMSSKQSLVMGLLAGIAVISVVGFFVLLANGSTGLKLGEKTTNTNIAANANVNTNVVPTPSPSATGDISKISPVGSDDYIRGNANAKVTLIEFSDFQCPYCQRHYATINQLAADYGDKIRVVFRHFPLSSIHPNAQKAAEAAECAGEQGKFWEMHDQLFEAASLDIASLKTMAGQLGLSQSQFDSCLDSSKYASKVAKQAAEAQAAGITGTPGTFVNSELVKGAYPVETFKQIIDGLLQ